MTTQPDTTELRALAAALMAADPEPYYSDTVGDATYYGMFAEALIAAGWRVHAIGATMPSVENVAPKWHQHGAVHWAVCPVRSRWRRAYYHQPFWRDDKTAQMLGVAQYGCRRCGRGAIEERDRHQPTSPGDGDD